MPQQTPGLPEQEQPAEPETTTEIQAQVPDKVADMALQAGQTEPPPTLIEPFQPYARTSFEDMTKTEKQMVTSSILAQQFIREKPVTEQLFGTPIARNNPGPIADFHYPVKVDMLSMLDTPMPDLPFAYQENLIYFAYDPGVRGDLQKFWDVITPEFGWRTKYGTEVRCIWVLVIAACGWK